MQKPVPAFFFCCLFLVSTEIVAADSPVTLVNHDKTVTLSNGIVSIVATKTTGTITSMTLGDSPNLAGKGAYFAVENSVGRDGWDVHNALFKVLRNTPDLVEMTFGARIGGIYFTQDYIMRRGDHGFYVTVLCQRRPGDPPENTGQIRWSFYLNDQLFDYQLASDSEQGKIPDMRDSKPVQDATFRLTDGSVYTKYNYVTYLEEDDVHGECGSRPNSYGAFMLMPSREYLQAPTKQEITVHQGPIIHRILASGHFEPRELSSPAVPVGWTKCCGPWMVYLNTGDSPQQMWADAKAKVKSEQAQWPYKWMQSQYYPLRRGDVTGSLKLYDGKQPASYALMILTAPQPDWQLQVMNYIFSTRADADGNFTLPHVRPGLYTLFAAVPGVTGQFRRDNILVSADGIIKLGAMNFVPAYYSAKLWEIGYADLRTTGFCLSDQPRQYGMDSQVPANLTYNVGTSDPSRDWYYAQDKPGDWQVAFNLNRTYGGQAVLSLGIAGQTNDPRLQVSANGHPVGVYTGGNSSALYRSAILGSSYEELKILRFPAAALRKGPNVVTFHMVKGSVMYDVVKLEIDDPNLPRQIPPTPPPPAADLTAWGLAPASRGT